MLLLAAVFAAAQNPLEEKGFEHFYNLEYDAAANVFAQAVERNPNSPEAHNHLAMAVLYRTLLRAGALESEMVTGNNPFLRRAKVEAPPEERRRFEDAIAAAIAISEGRLKTDPRDVQALYAQGVSYGLRANYQFLVRKEWRAALKSATTARKLQGRVTDIDPTFIDAKLVQGIHEFVVGNLPWHWKMLGFLVGYRGDKDKGIRTLEQVAGRGTRNRVDAEVLLCAVYRRERQSKRAIPLLQDLIRRYPRNYLFRLELSQMYSDAGDKAGALAALDGLERLARRGTVKLPLERIAYARGNIQFWYGDLEDALENMRRAAAAAEDLDLNTGVLAWLRLGQIHDLRGERNEAREAYRRAIAFAPDSDAAKESRRFLDKPYTKRG
jgi:tetratricopeptide (TPR) repeat protein